MPPLFSIYDTTKFVTALLGCYFYKASLEMLMGPESTGMVFIMQAIYCRIAYFKDSHMLDRIPTIHAEEVIK
jgi:hypothetical protein